MPYRMTPEAVEARFWGKVNKEGPVHPVLGSSCWLWTSAVFQRTGYGSVTQYNKQKQAHRASWELHYGPIPAGHQVLHRCDVRLCVRPEHLFLGDHAANMRDMSSKGRASRACGEAIGTARLTRVDVDRIREVYARGEITYYDLASEYNVAFTTIAAIITRRSWK